MNCRKCNKPVTGEYEKHLLCKSCATRIVRRGKRAIDAADSTETGDVVFLACMTELNQEAEARVLIKQRVQRAQFESAPWN